MADKLIAPTILKGTRNFLPPAMARRNRVMGILQDTFEQFGYAPIQTPILAPADAMLDKYGEEADKLRYSFVDHGGRQVALPYDLTVPFARLVAANHRELPLPFKRYQIQRVWRAERPQKGRLREFYQCDIDIIGSRQLTGEAEMAKVIVTLFERLQLPNVTIKFNSRRLLNEVLCAHQAPADKLVAAIRIIDKLAKIGRPAVLEQLATIGVTQAAEILTVLKPAATNSATLHKLQAYDTAELATFLNLCQELAVPEPALQFDPTLARGLDYYTGLTFEVVSAGSDLGSLCAGGRYDDLCAMFTTEDFSGVGISFGFERIMLLLEELALFPEERSSSQVLVTIFDEQSVAASLRIYNELITARIPAEIYLDQGKLAKQFKFADKKHIPFVIIQGPDELADGAVTIKRLENGKQKTLAVNQMAAYLRGYYETRQ